MMDYHVHTLLCNHAQGGMQHYIACAAKRGLSEICFLDHLTLNEEGRHLSMTPMDVPLYYYAARRLAAGTRDIRVRVGLEVDFTPELASRAGQIVEGFDFDVIGGSMHFAGGHNLVSTRAAQNQAHRIDDAVYDRYLELLDTMAECPYIDVVCHLDVIKKFGARPGPRFYEKLDPILDKIARAGKVVEVNTSGLHHPAAGIYPDERIIEKCRHKNIAVCLGSDAHRPEQVGRDFDEALEQIRNAGYQTIAGFDRRTPFAVPLPRLTGGAN